MASTTFTRPDKRNHYKAEPARQANVQADVVVPLLQALVTGLGACALIGLPCYLFGASLQIALGIGGPVGILAFLACWLMLLQNHQNLLWKTEELLHADLDRNGIVGKPKSQRVKMEVVERKPGALAIYNLNIPAVEPHVMKNLARAMLNNGTLAEASWAGGGKPFSLPGFADLRSEMIRAGLWEWKNSRAHNQGIVVTASGRAWARKILEPEN